MNDHDDPFYVWREEDEAKSPCARAIGGGVVSAAKQYRDMSAEEMLAWGAAESAARQADLQDVRSAEALKQAQENAERRRKAIGASRSAASSMVIEANRAARIAASRSAS